MNNALPVGYYIVNDDGEALNFWGIPDRRFVGSGPGWVTQKRAAYTYPSRDHAEGEIRKLARYDYIDFLPEILSSQEVLVREIMTS